MDSDPPIIMTQWGAVTESARLQAAINMREDPEVFERVLKLKLSQHGGNLDRALDDMKRCYPESFGPQ